MIETILNAKINYYMFTAVLLLATKYFLFNKLTHILFLSIISNKIDEIETLVRYNKISYETL